MFDLDRVIRYNIVRFAENKKKENINLRLRVKIVNVLLKKQSIDRSCKNTINQKSNLNLFQSKLDLFQTDLFQSEPDYSNLF